MNPLQMRAKEQAENQEQKNKFDSECYVEGFATRFEPYVLYEYDDGPIYESFTAENFKDCDMSDIIMQYDHNGKVLARQRNNTLSVEVTDEGLFVCADLSKSEASRALYEEISNGLVDRMSWGFIPEGMNYDKDTRTITYDRIKKIFDVSAVSLPANENTNIQARSFVDGVLAKRAQELRELEEIRLRLIIKSKGE